MIASLYKTSFLQSTASNKSTENMNVTKDKVMLRIGPFSESFKMASNLLDSDNIARKKRCEKHKEIIDCKNNIVKIVYRHTKPPIRALESLDSGISVETVKLRDMTALILAVALSPPNNL